MSLDGDAVRRLLPWRSPFVMVDGITECVPHQRVVATKVVAADEAITRGLPHPCDTPFPSAMVLEGLSQSAALLFQLSYGPLDSSRVPLLGHMHAEVRDAARAGDTIVYTVRAVKMTSTSGLFEGIATARGSVLVEAELAFSVPPGTAS